VVTNEQSGQAMLMSVAVAVIIRASVIAITVFLFVPASQCKLKFKLQAFFPKPPSSVARPMQDLF
jgi:hypothetical protein